MITNTLTPAQEAKKRLAEAEARATALEWERYREAEEAHRLVRFPDLGWNHGIVSTYTNRRCRCDECREAWRVYVKDLNKRKREANPRPPKPAPHGRGRRIKAEMHGTLTGYAYGCRCDRCKDARRTWVKTDRAKNHGTEYVYHLGCRCKRCTQAHTTARDARRRKEIPIPLREHGTDRGYTHFKCRCDECREAHNAAMRVRNMKMRTYYREHPEMIPDSKHGTETGYTSYSCRCDKCKESHRIYIAQRRARKREVENG